MSGLQMQGCKVPQWALPAVYSRPSTAAEQQSERAMAIVAVSVDQVLLPMSYTIVVSTGSAAAHAGVGRGTGADGAVATNEV